MATSPYDDTSTNINGVNDWVLIESTGLLSRRSITWLYYTTFYRYYETTSSGDETIMQKMENQHCLVGYIETGTLTSFSGVPTNSTFKHNMAYCYYPNVGLGGEFIRYGLTLILIGLILIWIYYDKNKDSHFHSLSMQWNYWPYIFFMYGRAWIKFYEDFLDNLKSSKLTFKDKWALRAHFIRVALSLPDYLSISLFKWLVFMLTVLLDNELNHMSFRHRNELGRSSTFLWSMLDTKDFISALYLSKSEGNFSSAYWIFLMV